MDKRDEYNKVGSSNLFGLSDSNFAILSMNIFSLG